MTPIVLQLLGTSNTGVAAGEQSSCWAMPAPNIAERASLLEEGISGTTLLLSGFVLTPDCTPVARALIDFWHCDDAGVYDNAGYRFRGHQFTNDKDAMN